MPKRPWLVAVLVFLGFAPAALAQTSDPDIRKVADDYTAAYNKGDSQALAALYTADAWRLGPTGEMVKGRAAIEKGYADAFAGPSKGSTLTLRPGDTLQVTPDVAVIEGGYEVAGAAGPLKGRYVNTLKREGGSWKLASVVTIPEQPAGPPR
jgi:uncharacterized protein (TIGR02246 family)